MSQDKTPVMRSIRETAATGIISEHTLRLMVKQNKVPGVVYVGKKALINYNLLADLLNSEEVIHVEG